MEPIIPIVLRQVSLYMYSGTYHTDCFKTGFIVYVQWNLSYRLFKDGFHCIYTVEPIIPIILRRVSLYMYSGTYHIIPIVLRRVSLYMYSGTYHTDCFKTGFIVYVQWNLSYRLFKDGFHCICTVEPIIPIVLRRVSLYMYSGTYHTDCLKTGFIVYVQWNLSYRLF